MPVWNKPSHNHNRFNSNTNRPNHTNYNPNYNRFNSNNNSNNSSGTSPPFHRRHSHSGNSNYHNNNRPYHNNRFYNNSSSNSSHSNNSGSHFHLPAERERERSRDRVDNINRDNVRGDTRGLSVGVGGNNSNASGASLNTSNNSSTSRDIINYRRDNTFTHTSLQQHQQNQSSNDVTINSNSNSNSMNITNVTEEGEIDIHHYKKNERITSSNNDKHERNENNERIERKERIERNERNERTISFKPPPTSSKFIPPSSSSSLVTSKNNIRQQHEEGEIQSNDNNSSSNSTRTTLSFSKVPTWTPPPGASTSSSNNSSTTIPTSTYNNNTIDIDNYDTYDKNTTTSSINNNNSSDNLIPFSNKKRSWSTSNWNNKGNNINTFTNNSNHHHPHSHHRDSNDKYHHQKWDKPNHFKKRFTESNNSTSYLKDNNNATSSTNTTTANTSPSVSSWKRNSLGSGSGINHTSSSYLVGSSDGDNNNSNVNSGTESKEASGSNYYGGPTHSFHKTKDDTYNTYLPSLTSPTLSSTTTTTLLSSPTIRKKTFQPPSHSTNKEKKNLYSSPQPQSHSNYVTSSCNSNDTDMNTIQQQTNNSSSSAGNSTINKKEWEPKHNMMRKHSFKSQSLSSIPPSSVLFDKSSSLDKSVTRLPSVDAGSSTVNNNINSSGSNKNNIQSKQLNDPRWKPSLQSSSSSLPSKDRSDNSNLRIASEGSASNNNSTTTTTLSNKLETPMSTTKSSTAIDVGSTPNPSTETSSAPQSTTTKIPLLTCSALGSNDDIAKGKRLIKKLSILLSDKALNNDDVDAVDMHLPSSDQIHCGMKKLESQIEERKEECKKIRIELKHAEKKHEQEEKEKEAATAKVSMINKENDHDKISGYEEVDDEGGVKMDTTTDLDDETAALEMERITEELRLKEEMDKIKEDNTRAEKEIESLLLELAKVKMENERVFIEAENAKENLENENLIELVEAEFKEAKEAFELSVKVMEESRKRLEFVNVLQSNVVDEVSEVSSNETFQSELAEGAILPDTISPRLQHVLAMARDNPEDMSNLISSIYKQTRQTAEAAHDKVLSVLQSTNKNCKGIDPIPMPPMLLAEPPVNFSDENALGQYFEHWSNMAQEVTGPGNALYTEPSETPLYEQTQEKHENIKFLVKEHIRSKKQKLHNRWIQLAEEYAVRHEKYTKETNIPSSSFTSADTLNLPILSGGDYSPEAASGRGGNPYRRARRGVMSGIGGSDVVRSEYEQQQIIAQLEAKANMEKRIKQGGSELPRQQCQLEKDICASYRDTMSSRYVSDPLQEAKEQRRINPWSDIEKCIFLDRFLQYPKDFHKIASFLKNKSVHDCISFYYDSKQSVPYKHALKEHLKRKKRRGDAVRWDATIQAAISVGATVRSGISSEKPLIFDLPHDDMTFQTRFFHPMEREIFDAISGTDSSYIEVLTNRPVMKPIVKRKASSIVYDLFTLDPSERKFLRSFPETVGKSGSGSDLEPPDEKVTKTLNTPSAHDSIKANEKNEVGKKKIPQKWSNEEKAKFHEMFETTGKKWDLLSEAIGTKTSLQVKKFYYEHKKLNNKKKAGLKATLNSSLNENPEASFSVFTKETRSTQPQLAEAATAPKVTQEIVQFMQKQVDTPHQGLQGQSEQGITENWMYDNQQRQYALAFELEQQRQQQQLAEHHQQLINELSQGQHRQQFLEFQRQHEEEQQQQQRFLNEQRHFQQQIQIQNFLNHQVQSEFVRGHQQPIMSNLNLSSWVLAQAAMRQHETRQQQPFPEYLDAGANLQNVVMALQQASQHQNNYPMSLGSNSNAENSEGQRHDLTLLAQMALNQNRNNPDSPHNR